MEELADSENLKFSAEICLRVRIPPPAPASPSRPVPLIEERGDFLRSVRRFDGFTPAPNHNMRFSPFHAFLPIQSLNHDMRLPPSPISPSSVPFFRAAASDSPIRSAVSYYYSAWRDAMPLPSFPRFLSDRRGGSAPLLYPLLYPSNRLLAFLLASLSARRLGVSPTIRFPIRAAGRIRVFRAYIFFTSISPGHVIHLIGIHAGVVERQTRQI